jgi:RNA polymerase sigma factor (TIGR02999 family)
MSDPGLPSEASVLLNAAAQGDRTAAERLLPLVYDQLRRAAQQLMGHERAGHTLSATALVHEAYMRLVGAGNVEWNGKGHFYAAAAEAMRRILIEHARARGRIKRGGELRRANFESLGDLAASEPDEILSFDEALQRLEKETPDAAAVVRLRFFAGLSVDETAQALQISDRTVDRLWTFARAWLFRAMRTPDGD